MDNIFFSHYEIKLYLYEPRKQPRCYLRWGYFFEAFD